MTSTTLPPVPVDKRTAAKLAEAAKLAKGWTATRDNLIIIAVEQGGTLREVAALVGLSHTAIAKIVERAK